jgi:anti-anti-sigma factor
MSSTLHIKKSDLCFDNVYQIYNEIKQWMSKHSEKELVIDCCLVKYVDSAGVAMLVDLKKLARLQYKKTVNFNISPPIKQLLSFYSVENFLD